MKFYWVTDNYRVNLESIFSLEKKYVDNSSAIKDWENAFQYWIDEIKEKGLHTMDYDIEILDDSNINQEDANIIAKVMHRRSVPYMSGFEVGTSFFNAKSLTENHYLTFGHNTLEYLKDKPYITLVKA